MKITLNLNEVNELIQLSRADQKAVVEYLNELSRLDEDSVELQDEPNLPSLAQQLRCKAIKQAKAARRQRERRQQQRDEIKRPHFEGSVQHEVTSFERRFRDDFHTLISRHMRVLKKSFSNETPQLRSLIIGYAHSYMRHTILANVPACYRAEKAISVVS